MLALADRLAQPVIEVPADSPDDDPLIARATPGREATAVRLVIADD